MPARKAPARAAPKTAKVLAKRAAKPAAKSTAKPKAKKPVRLAKSDGAAPVATYIASLETYQRKLAERIDAIAVREVPELRKAIKWRSPMFGTEASGWFMAMAGFQNYLKVNFFSGAMLKPTPPEGAGKGMRSINLGPDAKFDEKQFTSWVKQASSMPGWGSV